jgi:hypothetical protein
MDAAARQFRESRIHLLRFYASSIEQTQWQERTPTLASDELMEWWLEDFVPDSTLFQAAFSPEEIAQLTKFHLVFERASGKYPHECPKVDDLLNDPSWKAVIEEAKAALASFRNEL